MKSKLVLKKITSAGTPTKEEVFNPTPKRGLVLSKSKIPLLDVIAKHESGGNYNAYYQNARNKDINFTGMTVAEVRNWQRAHLSKGNKSSAVGKYQIISGTLDSLIKELGLTGNELFNEELQDRLAIQLMNRRGYNKFLSGQMSAEEFGNNLAMEWAALPVITGPKAGRSYYSGDGLNEARTDIDTVLSALRFESETNKS